jgi:hypothetical protein
MADIIRSILKWKVLRQHEGDRMYQEGETRLGTKAELGHLSPKTLELIGPSIDSAKSEPAPLNKAEGASPANKAATGRKAK